MKEGTSDKGNNVGGDSELRKLPTCMQPAAIRVG